MLVTFLIPVTAILLGATLLDERLAPRHFVGMALIAAGLAAIDGRSSPAGRRPRPSEATVAGMRLDLGSINSI